MLSDQFLYLSSVYISIFDLAIRADARGQRKDWILPNFIFIFCRRQERLPAIGFTAYISQHLSSLGHQHTILFDKTKSNYGNAYDNLTGVFIAPQEGVYVFFSNIMSEASSDLTYIETEIVKNGDQLAEMYSGAQQAFDSSSNMAVTKLNKGDHVWVRVHGSWSNNFKIHCCFSTFSGFLIGEYFLDENIVG